MIICPSITQSGHFILFIVLIFFESGRFWVWRGGDEIKYNRKIPVTIKRVNFIDYKLFHNNSNKLKLAMQSYKKSTNETAKFNDSDLPTATKTNYIETSPYLNTPSLKSPSRIHAKMQEVRESIGSMINEMSHKKSQNNQAIERVKSVNADAMGMLRDGDYSTYTPKKSDRPYNPRENRTIGGLPGYEYQNNPFEPGFGYSSEFNLNDDGQNEISPIPQFKSLEQENYELRKALNEHIRMNNDLLKRIQYLEAENYDLKVQLGHPDVKLRSTRYGSISYDDPSNEFSPAYRYQPGATAKLGGVENPNIRSSLNIPLNYGSQQNFYNSGNRQGNNYGGSGNRNINDYHNTSSLFNDLQHLKRENEALRQNTIALLQRN